SLHDRQLGCLNFERLEFSGAAVLVRRGHGIADDSDWCVLRDYPFSDPEFALGLRSCRTVPHGNVGGLTADIHMDDELSGFLALARGRVRDKHSPPDGLSPLEAIPENAVFGMSGRLKQRHVTVD